MIPPPLRRWILIWTPILWLVLELVLFPKDRPVSSGFVHVMGGFVDKRVGNYPAWTLAIAAVALLAAGISGRRARGRRSRLPIVLLVMAAVTALWALAQMGFAQLNPAGRGGGYSWLFQTVLLALAATAVWAWAIDNPDRAETLVWNIRQVWRLFRTNRRGVLGLGILAFFTAMALLAPFLVNHAWLSSTAQVTPVGFQPPSFHNYLLWFGSDESGLSVLAQFIWSTRISLFVGVIATVVTTVIGAGVGIVAGYYGKATGETLMRTTDMFLVLPWLPFAMVLAAAWGQNYGIIILIIAVTSWAGTARVVRAQVLSAKEASFVERARAIGSRDLHIMWKHILPSVTPLILANAVLTVAVAIYYETTLSFLGLGDPLNFSWGTMLGYVFWGGGSGLPAATFYTLAPGLAVVLVCLAFNFVGSAFDQVLDPKLRKREESDGGAPLTQSPAFAMTADGGGQAVGSSS